MYKLFIVDDEELVIDGLTSCIEWSDYNIEVIGSATNGKTAYDLVTANNPDIVITDIRMPGMNGLDLIEKVRTEKPDILFVIFSGYNEFEYARKALQLETVDYLIKPVDLDELTRAICKVIERYEKNKADKKEKETLGSYRPVLEEKYLIGAIFGSSEENSFDPRLPNYTILLIDDIYGKAIDNNLKILIKDAFMDYGLQNYVLEHMGSIIVIFSYILENVSRDIENEFRKILEHLSLKISGEYNKTVKFGVGNTYKDLTDLKKSYIEAKAALDFSLYFDQKITFYYEAVYFEGQEFNFNVTNIINDILFNNDLEKAISDIDILFSTAVSVRLHPQKLKKICMDVLYHLEYLVHKEFNIDLEEIVGTDLLPYKEIDQIHSQKKLRSFIVDFLRKVHDYVFQRTSTYKSKVILKIKQFIMNNISSEITLNGIADFIHMNPTYISSIFKEKTGETVFDYIIAIRMEKAKSLIREDRYRIKEIAEMTGYKDQRYFCQAFKKFVGLTATEYREKCIIDKYKS